MALIDVFGDGSFMAGVWFGPKRLSHPDKVPVSIGSRTIRSATTITGGVRLELENGEHNYTINTTEFWPGSATEKTFTWKAGGSWPIPATDPKTVNSYTETNNTVGSAYGAAQPGDAVGISGLSLDDWRFVLSYVKPFDGSEAAGWGDTRVVAGSTFRIGGFFVPSSANLEVPGTEEHGRMVAPSTGDFVKEGATVYTWINQVSRPTVATHQFWYDGDIQEIYFAPADDTHTVDIRYGVMDKAGNYIGTFTESYTINTDPVTATGIDYSEWIGSVTKSTKYLETGAAVSPAPTETDSAGQLQMQFSGNDAGKWIVLRAEESAPADSPSNGVMLLNFPGNPDDDEFHGYLSFGRKRDVIEVKDETGFLAANLGELEGKEVTFYWSDAVLMPVDDVEWRAGTGAWASVGAGNWTANHGTGRVWIKDTWLTAHPTVTEFRIPEAQYIDGRGFLPASVMNKVQGMSDGLTWVNSTWGAANGNGYNVGFRILNFTEGGGDPVSGCTLQFAAGPIDGHANPWIQNYPPDDIGFPNFVQWGFDHNVPAAVGWFRITGDLVGPPDVVTRMPDGTIIDLAYMVINGGGLTYSHAWMRRDEDDAEEFFSSSSKVGNAWTVCRMMPSGDIEGIGGGVTVAATGDAFVIECSGIIQAMLNDRDSGSIGYILLPGPPEMAGDLTAAMTAVGNILPGYGVHNGGLGLECGYDAWDIEQYSWGTLTFGPVWIKCSLPALDATDVITERYPDFSE